MAKLYKKTEIQNMVDQCDELKERLVGGKYNLLFIPAGMGANEDDTLLDCYNNVVAYGNYEVFDY